MRILSILVHAPDRTAAPGEADVARLDALIDEMRAKGVLLDTGGRMPDHFEMIVSRANGKTTITDGPFAESKEVVGGYALMDVADRDDAIAWTNRFLDLIGDATCHLHEVSSA